MRVNSKLRFGLRRLHGLVIENANLQHQVKLLLFILFGIYAFLDS
jgi:hypothetical protein